MAAKDSSATFTRFAELPYDLRYMIWKAALPEEDEPALFFYKDGCWNCPPNEGYDINARDRTFVYFRHDLLDHVRVAGVNISLLSVNGEARRIALAWVRKVRKRGYQMRQSDFFVRPFNPMCDTLYVTQDDWDAFYHQFLFGRRVFLNDFGVLPVKRLAMPETVLMQKDYTFLILRGVFRSLETLSIIVGPTPHLEKEVTARERQRWEWEIIEEPLPECAGNDECVCNREDAYSSIAHLAGNINSYVVQPVRAVAK